MRKFFLGILFILISFIIKGQDKIYKEFDTWEQIINSTNKIGLKAYITVDSVLTKSGDILYVYSFNAVSLSTYDNEPTTTWLYGTRVYFNGIEVSKKLYPNGFLVGVDTNSTNIYKYTSSDTKVKFIITWEQAIADPRNRGQ
jgi:hypothetical protein